MKIIVHIEPMGAPRMTQRDRWAKRPCVMRYRAFKDVLRASAAGFIPKDASRVSWKAYFPLTKSWSKKKKAELTGQPHQQKPDRDNIDKAILDSLFKEDSVIASGTIAKYWDDGKGPRIELEIE